MAPEEERRPPGQEEAPRSESENESPSGRTIDPESALLNRSSSLRPPTFIVPRAESIPPTLTAIDQWVAWRYDPRVDKKTGKPKPTKVPVDPLTGLSAKSNTKSTWGTFNQAWERYKRDGLDGVGFVLTLEAGVVGIDIDHCRNPETGEVDGDALAIVRAIDSYTEISPSGTGVRIFARGTLPKGWHKRGDVEMYDSGRYLTVTGKCLDAVRAIEERTEQIAQVHARIASVRPQANSAKAERASPQREPKAGHPKHEVRRRKTKQASDVLGRLRSGRSGEKFVALYDKGDWEGQGYGSQSEADLALTSMLVLECGGDPAMVDSLFRGSGLMRVKWDEPHDAGGRTYGEITIAKAVETYGSVALSLGSPAFKIPDLLCLLSLTLAAGRLMERHPHDLLWSHVGNRYRWGGSHWFEDRSAVAEQWADEVVQALKWEADQLAALARGLDQIGLDAALVAELELQFPRGAANGEETWEQSTAGHLRKRSGDLLAFYRRLERPAGLAEILGRVAIEHTHPTEDLDQRPLRLACPNGTLELQTGQLRAAERNDLITKVTSVEFDSAAKSAAWDDALRTWTDGDVDLMHFLQVAFGFSLLGNPLLGRYCFMLHGPGQTGKSAFLEALAGPLGDYASSFSWRAFERKQGASHDEDLAALRGLRFVFSNEAGLVQLDTEKLKAVTSGEEQHVSRKHEKSFRMRPQFVVWTATNSLPELPAEDSALWSRVRVIPFLHTFEISGVREKLATDPDVRRAVLAWGVEGAREYLASGKLPACSAVDRATEAARKDLNPIAAWMDECVARDPQSWSAVRDLFANFGAWCDVNRVFPRNQISGRRFGRLLVGAGFKPGRRGGARGYEGLRVGKACR
jgi:putative DNA primase/helicase